MDKRIAEHIWKKSGMTEDLNSFKAKRNRYIHACEKAKIQYYSQNVKNCEGNLQKLFRVITEFTDGDKTIFITMQ